MIELFLCKARQRERNQQQKKIVNERGTFGPNEKASPQHTKTYVRNSLIEVRCKIHRSERFFNMGSACNYTSP